MEVAEHLGECDSCRAVVETIPGDHLVHLVCAGLEQLPKASRLRVHPGYEVFEPIGRGGMGVVYRARQVGLDRIVALKLLRHDCPCDAGELARFLAEAGAMGRLTHPNFVQVYEVGEQDGRPYIACEYVPGGGLDRQLTGKPLPVRSACRLVSILARAVELAHVRSVIHRDLKPSNVLLSWKSGEQARPDDEAFWEAVVPKIGDFGVAKYLDQEVGVTRTGEIIGTPEYMAPELASGQSNAARAETDVYSLGVILYELLTGRRPFQGGSITETLDLVRSVDPVPPRRWLPRLSRSLDVVCLKCLEKEPERRYSSAALLADDLDRILEGRPILARPPTSLERFGKWLRRNPPWAALILLGTLSTITLAAGATWHVQRLGVEVRRATSAESSALGMVREGYDALDQLIQEIVRDHPETPAWADLDTHVKEKALRYYYGVLKGADDSNPRVRLTRGLLLVYAGSIHVTLRRYEKATADLEAARDLLEPLTTFPELTDEAEDYLSNCEYNLGQAEFYQGRKQDGARLVHQSIDRLNGLSHRGVSIPRLEHRLALRAELLAEFAGATGDFETMISELQTAIESREGYAAYHSSLDAASPEDLNRLQLIKDLLHLSFVPNISQRLDEATAALDKAESLLQRPPEIGSTLSGQKALMQIHSHRAVLAVESGNVDEALAWHDRGIEIGRQTLPREPNDQRARADLFNLYRAKAYTLCRAGRAVESFPFWEEALSLVDALGRDFCRAEITLERAIIGDHLVATAEAAEIAGGTEVSNDTWLMLARVYSRAIEAVERDPEPSAEMIARYAKQGTDALRSIESWLINSPPRLDEIDHDPALARLRELSPFREWRDRFSTVP